MIAYADVLGFVLTLVVLFFLFTGGYAASVLTLQDDASREPGTVFIETIVGATALALGIGLVLGALRHLEITYALGLLATIVIGLVAIARRRTPRLDLAPPLAALASRIAGLVREHPALAIVAANAIFLEGAFALLHPPLAWDSLELHTLLAAHWFHTHDLAPFLGAPRLHVLGASPAAGSVYLWWWLAAAHSELYLNLAYLPHWLLLGAASGSIARQLGAARFASFAAVTPMLLPLVLRWSTTQYPDALLTSMLLAALHFALRFASSGRLREMAWAGAALGVAIGTKGSGIAYGIAMLAPLAIWLPRSTRERWRGLAIALGVTVALGGFFYVRNAILTGTPFFPATLFSFGTRSVCDPATMIGPREQPLAGGETFLRIGELVRSGKLLATLLGSATSSELESGIGPAFALVVTGLVVLPRAVAPERRWIARTLVTFVLGVVVIWLLVPQARGALAFRNVRYLEPAAVLGCTTLFAWLDRREVPPAWGTALAVLIAAQGLLSQTVLLASGPRTVLFALDAVVLVAAASPHARDVLRRRAGASVVVALALFAASTPWFAEFRDLDRARAYGEDVSGHDTLAFRHARAWAWLDSNGADGTVAFVSSPLSYFYYPAMGMRLERRAIYVNADAREGRSVTEFPACRLREHPDRDAWLRRLDHEGVRWLLVSRYPPAPFPIEAEWAQTLATRFELRYGDPTNLLFERKR